MCAGSSQESSWIEISYTSLARWSLTSIRAPVAKYLLSRASPLEGRHEVLIFGTYLSNLQVCECSTTVLKPQRLDFLSVSSTRIWRAHNRSRGSTHAAKSRRERNAETVPANLFEVINHTDDVHDEEQQKGAFWTTCGTRRHITCDSPKNWRWREVGHKRRRPTCWNSRQVLCRLRKLINDLVT